MRMRKGSRGVTLVELCFGLAVVATLAGLATPQFRAELRSSAVRSATFELLAGLQQVRAASIAEGRQGMLCLSDAAGNCLPDGARAGAWQAFVDVNGRPSLVTAQSLPAGVELRSSRARLAFWPDSLSASTGTLTICDAQGSARPRSIVISQGGRARLVAAADPACR